ncbi:hypothetical protein D3C84_883560 [compost metagenome]
MQEVEKCLLCISTQADVCEVATGVLACDSCKLFQFATEFSMTDKLFDQHCTFRQALSFHHWLILFCTVDRFNSRMQSRSLSVFIR